MTATEGRIKPQSISDDIAAIEEALAAKDGDYIAYVAQVSDPARLRRVLDTMQAMGEAMAGVAKHIEGRLPMRGDLRDNDSSRAALGELRAALALYEGKQ